MSSWSAWQGINFSTRKAADNAKKITKKNIKKNSNFEYEFRNTKGTRDFPYRVEFRMRGK
jgi:hypothetical protein